MMKRRAFLKMAGLAVVAPKMLMAKNKAFITLLDIELPSGGHKYYKNSVVKMIDELSIRINGKPLSDYEDVVIRKSSFSCESSSC